MSNKLFQTIKKLRLENGFSQGYMAEKLNMSRPTYVQIEKGERELTISEAEKSAAIFSMSLNDLLNGKQRSSEVELEKEEDIKKKDKPEMRIIVSRANVKKFKEVLLYLLEKVGARPNIGETVIYKLLYFIDFDYYEKYEEQLIGAKYIRNTYGPTPVHFKKVVEEMVRDGQIEEVKSKYFKYPQKKYLPRLEPNLSKLSGREIEHIDCVLSKLAGKTARELTSYSHTDTPWMIKKQGEILDYESVFYRDPIHSVRNNSHDQL